MISALRLLTLCFLVVAVAGLQLVLAEATTPPRSELVVDCLSGDFEFPGRYTERQSIIVRPAVIRAPVRIEALSITDGPLVPR